MIRCCFHIKIWILPFLILACCTLETVFSFSISFNVGGGSTSAIAKTNIVNKAQAQNSTEIVVGAPKNRDAMIARAAVLRQGIMKKQLELQRLEREIQCCTATSSPLSATNIFGMKMGLFDVDVGVPDKPLDVLVRTSSRAVSTFWNSTQVLLRKLDRVKTKEGRNNQRYMGSVEEYALSQSEAGARIISDLVLNHPDRLLHLADWNTPSLLPHVPAILGRLDRLENHVSGILEKVLNNRKHLQSIEPYLSEVLERLDDIEPHLPWILKNVDVLAPYTGLLLRHIDALLLYAEGDDVDSSFMDIDERYALAEQLLPYLEFYVSRLDTVGPHLPLLRPHINKLVEHNRIAKITPHIDRLFARGYLNVGTSANLDVLLFWVGWTLNIPLLPRIFFAIPGSPRFVTFLANRMPRRFVRKNCPNVQCSIDGDYGTRWNRLSKD